MMRFRVFDALERGRDIGRNGFGHPGMIGMILCGLFFLGLLVFLVLLLVAVARKGRWHHPVGPNGTAPGHEKVENAEQTADVNSSAINALTILNERYAKGEINQEEYLSKKSDLQK